MIKRFLNYIKLFNKIYLKIILFYKIIKIFIIILKKNLDIIFLLSSITLLLDLKV